MDFFSELITILIMIVILGWFAFPLVHSKLESKKNIEDFLPNLKHGLEQVFDLNNIEISGSHCFLPAFKGICGCPSDYSEEILAALASVGRQIGKDVTLCFIETDEDDGLNVMVAIWIKIEQ